MQSESFDARKKKALEIGADHVIDPSEGLITERDALGDVVAKDFDELVAHKDRHVKILVKSSG